MFDEIRDLTKKLVAIPSINTTVGEREIALYIKDYLSEIPYFQKHPDYIILQELEKDYYDRLNVFAYIKGEKTESKDTVLLHGHIDTVGIEDYKGLKDYAFDTVKLAEKLTEMELPEEVLKDLHSGDYMFGRGACDMKSGDAVFLVLLKKLSEHPEKLKGNILLSLNPVEENLHTGIIEALKVLKDLKEKEGFKYKLAINNDFICPLFPGDSRRYIYTGTVGKLLPCFYIQGKETHVGQCFEGFDASMAASMLVNEINLNTEYCDGYDGEYTLPPSVLKIKDLKTWYNVQTADGAFVYFNYFVHNSTVEEIIKKLKGAAGRVLEELVSKYNLEYKKYCKLSGMAYKEIAYDWEVLEYQELYELARMEFPGDLEEYLRIITDSELLEGTDKRDIPLRLTRELMTIAKKKNPAVVLFFAAPYCPHNLLKEEGAEGRLVQEIGEIAKRIGAEYKEDYKLLKFFPSLSDSSYLKSDDSQESVEHLVHNFPQFEQLYPLPVEAIRELNIPCVNFGCYGKDAHKWTERVFMPYSFRVLPQLILETIKYYLK